MQPSSRMLVVSFKGTVLGWNRVKVDGGAKVVFASTTVVAGSLETGNSRFDGDPVTDSNVVYAFTNSNDDATGFVTKSALVVNLPWSKSGMLPEVDVRPTNASSTDVDEGHTRARSGRSRGDEFKLFLEGGPVERKIR